MKEKITKAEFINTWASEWDERTGWKVSEIYHQQMSEQLESLISQEVERRIKERMPSNFDIVTATSKWVEEKPERGYCKFGFIEGIVWLMSRLTCSEKPNNSQKTKGGAK